MNLEEYMSGGVQRIMAKAYRNVLTNPREAKFAWRMQRLFAQSEGLRKQAHQRYDVDVPPFLIASVATTCNLCCKGCYARQNGIAADAGKSQRPTLTPQQWADIFRQAADLGVNFSLVAGGEPLTRRDVLEAISTVDNMIFPVFTNGTLIGPTYIRFFRDHLNLVPVISIEGNQLGTDERRGRGVYEKALRAMQDLRQEKLFFGTSLTVTRQNMHYLSSDAFLDQLRDLGCKIVFFVEYVPTDAASASLALTEADSEELERIMSAQRERRGETIFLSFPGDEKHMGGCLAGGRGFFHIAPDGAAEPCPFSPQSDSNVVQLGLVEALRSPFFRRLRDARLVGGPHTGGCALYEHRDEVEALLQAV